MYTSTNIICRLGRDEKCLFILKDILETAYPGKDIYSMDIWQKFEDFERFFKAKESFKIGRYFIGYRDWAIRYDASELSVVLYAPDDDRSWRHRKNRDFHDRMMRKLIRMVYDRKIESFTDQKKYIFGTERAVFKEMNISLKNPESLGEHLVCFRYSFINHFLASYENSNLMFKYPFPQKR